MKRILLLAMLAVPALALGQVVYAPLAGMYRPQTGMRGPALAAERIDWSTPTASDCADRAADLVTNKGAAVTLARNDTNPMCCPLSSAACCSVGANKPCITSSGLEVYAATANGLTSSTPAACATGGWTCSAGITIEATSASCPLGPTGVRMALVDLSGSGTYFSGVAQGGTGISRSAWFARATGDSACNIVWSQSSTADFHTIVPPVVATRYWSSAAGGSGFIAARDNSGSCSRFCLDFVQVNNSPVADPFRTTSGSAYNGPATVVSEVPLYASDAVGAVGACFTGPGTAASRALGLGAGAPIYFSSANTISANDGTNTVGAISYTPNTEACVIVSWAGASMTIETLDYSTVTTGAYDGSWGTWTALSIGSNAGSDNFLAGNVRRVCEKRTAAEVRRCLR